MKKGLLPIPRISPCKFACQCPLLYKLSLVVYRDNTQSSMAAVYEVALGSWTHCCVARTILPDKHMPLVVWKQRVFQNLDHPEHTGALDYMRWRADHKKEHLMSALTKGYHAAHATQPSDFKNDDEIYRRVDPMIAWEAGNVRQIRRVLCDLELTKGKINIPADALINALYILGTRGHTGTINYSYTFAGALDAIHPIAGWLYRALQGMIPEYSGQELIVKLGSTKIHERNSAYRAAYMVGAVAASKDNILFGHQSVREMAEAGHCIPKGVFMGACLQVFNTNKTATRAAVDAWTIISKFRMGMQKDVVLLIAKQVWDVRGVWGAISEYAAKVHRDDWKAGLKKANQNKKNEKLARRKNREKRRMETRECVDAHKRLKKLMPVSKGNYKITRQYQEALLELAENVKDCQHCAHQAGHCEYSECEYCQDREIERDEESSG